MASVIHQGNKHIVECPFAATHELDNPEQAQLFADFLNEKDPAKAQSILRDLNARFARLPSRVIPFDYRH